MKRLKNLKILILSMAITGILGFNSVSAMNGDGVPIQQNNNNNNNNNIIDQNLLKQHYDLWIQMMQDIIGVLEFDTNKNKVYKYKENLQQIIGGNFANDDQRAQADVEGREKLLSAIKIKIEEMVQKIFLFCIEIIPNLNINNSQKRDLQWRATGVRIRINEMRTYTIDATEPGAGQSLFNFFHARIRMYNDLKHDLENIRNNNLPQNNNNIEQQEEEILTLREELEANANDITDDRVDHSMKMWKIYINEIADSMTNENSKDSVKGNLRNLEIIENTINNYEIPKVRKAREGMNQLCSAMGKKIDEMITELVNVNNVGNNVMDIIIPNNISEKEKRDLETEQYELTQTIKQLFNSLTDLKSNAKTKYILRNKYHYTIRPVIGDDYYDYFKYILRQYDKFMVDAQNFLNKVAQLQNNNNQ